MAFGEHSDGTQVSTMSGKDGQQETWRRILNNLPYLYKHKGTKRGNSWRYYLFMEFQILC